MCEMMVGGARYEHDPFVHKDLNCLSVGKTILLLQSLNGCSTIDQPKYASPLKPINAMKCHTLLLTIPVQPAELVHDQSRHVHFFSSVNYGSTKRKICSRNTENDVKFFSYFLSFSFFLYFAF